MRGAETARRGSLFFSLSEPGVGGLARCADPAGSAPSGHVA
jgi:hypothetical protein